MHFPLKEWILSRWTNALWQNIEKHQSAVLLPVSPPSSRHTHFKQGASNQLLRLLSSVIFVRAESRSNLNSITLPVICKTLTHSVLIQEILTRKRKREMGEGDFWPSLRWAGLTPGLGACPQGMAAGLWGGVYHRRCTLCRATHWRHQEHRTKVTLTWDQ